MKAPFDYNTVFCVQPIEEIIGALARHDSLDLTSSIDLTACSNRPYTEGKFYVYQGVLYNGTRVAIKSSRVYESLKPERDDARQRVVEVSPTEPPKPRWTDSSGFGVERR